MPNVVPFSKHQTALDHIDMHLVDVEAIVNSLRLHWENVDAVDPAMHDELASIAVTLSYLALEKIAAARKCVPAAYVHRVRAGRAPQ